MRVFARRERPHPGAQLTLFKARPGPPVQPVGDQPAGDAARLARQPGLHRRRAPGACPGRGRHPHRQGMRHRRVTSHAMAMNTAWFHTTLIAATLLAWLKLLALEGPLARAEPKTLRYKILHAAARLTRGGQQAAAENTGQLAMGGRHRRRLGPHHRSCQRSLTDPRMCPVPATRATRGPVEPRPPGPTAGRLS